MLGCRSVPKSTSSTLGFLLTPLKGISERLKEIHEEYEPARRAAQYPVQRGLEGSQKENNNFGGAPTLAQTAMVLNEVNDERLPPRKVETKQTNFPHEDLRLLFAFLSWGVLCSLCDQPGSLDLVHV